MATNTWLDLPSSSNGGTSSNVDIFDSNGNPITTTGGALNVNIAGGTSDTNTSLDGLNVFQTSQYTVGTSVVQVTPTPLANRSSVSLRVIATGGAAIYIGNSAGTTTSNGYPLFNGDTLQMDLTPVTTIYAIATAAGQNLSVLEMA